MVIIVFLLISEKWTLKDRDWNRIQRVEIKYLTTLICCTIYVYLWIYSPSV
jgi:hypothetical protein